MSHQALFRRFDEAIKLRRFKENKELNDKVQNILERIREKIAVKHTFQPFPQGSYEMGTGVKPLNADYDIDIALVFNVFCDEHTPVTVKGWVHDAVKGHTQHVDWRRPCITVNYQQRGEIKYHVDLAILAKDRQGGGMRLAIGKQNAAPPDQSWQTDDRLGFMKAIDGLFPGTKGEQFRRVIRSLKRWKDEHFPAEGRSAPTGLALTVAAQKWFQPHDEDDLGATLALVNTMRQNFRQTWDTRTNGYANRLSLPFSHAPFDDVLLVMSHEQMKQFHQRLEKLSGWLEEARKTGDTAPLRKAFGSDFPEK